MFKPDGAEHSRSSSTDSSLEFPRDHPANPNEYAAAYQTSRKSPMKLHRYRLRYREDRARLSAHEWLV